MVHRPHSAAPGDEPERSGAAELDQLLRRCARTDEEAFAALYDLTAARVHGLVLRVLRDPAQAEEVTQEVYLQVWRTAASFDPSRGSAASWLLMLAHRRAVDRVRSAESASRHETVYQRGDHRAPHDSTLEHVESAWEARRVRRALDELTALQREAVELAYFGGYTYAEVAGLLDLPLGTIKTRIRDGLIRLRDAMGMPS